jgi:hypothetical protein
MEVVLARIVAATVFVAVLTATALAGCSQAPKPPTPPPPPQAVSSVVAAPTDPAAAKTLVDEQRTRLAQAPSLSSWAFGEDAKIALPLTLAAAAKATGRTLRLPAPSVVGTPAVAVDYSRAGVGRPARFGLAAMYPDRALLFTARLVSEDPAGGLRAPSTEASYSATLVRHTAATPGVRWTRITVRGNPGIAFTRGAESEMTETPATVRRGAPGVEPSFVEWEEDGVRYTLMSYQLDPDQLLAIAGTMVAVKP